MAAWLECFSCGVTGSWKPGSPRQYPCGICGGVYRVVSDDNPADFEEHRSTNNEEEEED